ncbi:MAG: DEAD/DEAH box helicase [Actinomycetota bacterium]|nr:DEAD/DEAH box helicase [Actinomycetota bacterium]
MTSTTFESLGVDTDLCKALTERGITEPFPIQAMTIPDALAGRDVCGKAKTGSGKTLAFGLPVLQKLTKAQPKRPTAIALVPTRELALQVRDELAPLSAERGVVVDAIYGGARIDRQIKALHRGIDFAVATPGRMIDLMRQGEASMEDVDHIIVDEADRMADMGFLPQVEWILRQVQGKPQTLLFSATLDSAVGTLIDRYQTDPVTHEVASTSVTVEGMSHRFLLVHEMDRVRVVAAIAANNGRTLVFTRTKRGADRLAKSLSSEGVQAAAIHGDLRQKVREQGLKRFAEGKLNVLVATDVAARGIHVDEIDVVIHFDPPEDHKTYLHRSGRTARAGENGLAVTFVLWDQELEVKRLQSRLGMKMPIVEMFSNDSRLEDLSAWDPAAESAA